MTKTQVYLVGSACITAAVATEGLVPALLTIGVLCLAYVGGRTLFDNY